MTKTTIMIASLLAGCVTDEIAAEDLEYGATEQAIEDGSYANSWQVGRAAFIGCSATQIAPDAVLTALHCMPQVDQIVQFWTSATSFSSTTRTVSQVIMPPGTAIIPGIGYDWTDDKGDHADLVVLRLRLPMRRTIATLAWSYPGTSKPGQKVGNGNHEEAIPSGTVLMQRSDYTHGDDEDGQFYTNQDGTNKGDSGGPFYVNGKQVGVLTGAEYSPSLLVWRGWHTSIPHHIEFILDAIDYTWPYGAIDDDTLRSGPSIETLLYRSEQVCRYACDKTSNCAAYSFIQGSGGFTQCNLLSSVTDTVTGVSNGSSAAKP